MCIKDYELILSLSKLYLELFKHYERRVFRRRKKECQRSFCNECRKNLIQGTLCKECDANIHDKSFKYQTNAKTLIFTCREDKKCDQILRYEQFIVHKHKPRNFFEKEIENLQQMKMEYKKLAENVEFKKTRILEIDERVKNLKATISDNEDLIAEIYEAIGIAENTVANCETEKRNLKTQIANLKEDAKKLKSSKIEFIKQSQYFKIKNNPSTTPRTDVEYAPITMTTTMFNELVRLAFIHTALLVLNPYRKKSVQLVD